MGAYGGISLKHIILLIVWLRFKTCNHENMAYNYFICFVNKVGKYKVDTSSMPNEYGGCRC